MSSFAEIYVLSGRLARKLSLFGLSFWESLAIILNSVQPYFFTSFVAFQCHIARVKANRRLAYCCTVTYRLTEFTLLNCTVNCLWKIIVLF